MLFLAPLLMTVAAAAPAAPNGLKLAAQEFALVHISREVGLFCSEHLAQELGQRGLSIITSNEISSLLGMERQKQLLGCSEESTSCMTELANALGADGLLLGELGKFGDTYQLNLKVLGATNGQVLARHSASLKREEDLLPELGRAAEHLSIELSRALGRAAPVPALTTQTAASTPDTSLRRWAWIPAAVGGVAAIGGTIFFLQASAAHQQLTDPAAQTLTQSEASERVSRGSSNQTLAQVSYGVAAAGLLAAGAMYWFGAPAEPLHPVASLGSGQGWVGMGGAFP